MFQYDNKTRFWSVFMANGIRIPLPRKTKSESILNTSDELFQVSLQSIVNINHVDYFEDKEMVLLDGQRLKVTPHYLKEIKEKFNSI